MASLAAADVFPNRTCLYMQVAYPNIEKKIIWEIPVEMKPDMNRTEMLKQVCYNTTIPYYPEKWYPYVHAEYKKHLKAKAETLKDYYISTQMIFVYMT